MARSVSTKRLSLLLILLQFLRNFVQALLGAAGGRRTGRGFILADQG